MSMQPGRRDPQEFVAALDDQGGVAAGSEGQARSGELGPFAQQFAERAGRLFSTGTVPEVLEDIIGVAAQLAPTVTLVSVTLRLDTQRLSTPVSTRPVGADLDEAQYRAGHGPCYTATETPGPGLATASDLAATSSWPEFAAEAVRLGMRSLVSVGMFPARPDARMGTLNFYSATPAGLEQLDQNLALLLATYAGVATGATESLAAAHLRCSNLEKALESRDVIGQAKGILMERRKISADEAFDILRSTSQELNVKLAELARTVTTHHAEL